MTADEIKHWAERAQPTESLVYFRGNLAMNEGTFAPRDMAQRLQTGGIVNLLQRKTDEKTTKGRVYEYIMQKTTPPSKKETFYRGFQRSA